MSRPARKNRIHLYEITALFFIFLFLSNIPIIVSYLGGPPVALTYLAFMMVFVAVFGVLLLSRGVSGSPHAFPRHGLSLAVWLMVFFHWTLFVWLYSSQGAEPAIMLGLWTSTAVQALMFLFLLSQPRVRAPLLRVLAAVAAVGACIVIADFLNPSLSVTLGSTVFGRGAGLYQNPNLAGSTLVMA